MITHGSKGHQSRNSVGTRPSHTPVTKRPRGQPMGQRRRSVGPVGGRPTYRPANLPMTPTAPKPSTWQLLIGWGSRFQEARAQFPAEQGVAPHYIYEGRGSISSITKHPSNQVTPSRCSSSSLVEVLGLEEFRFES